MESGTSDLWQSRQRISAAAQLHIFESSGRDEMRKWTYRYLEILAEYENKCGRRTRSFEVMTEWKYGKRIFRSLEVKAEQKCGSGTSHLWKSRQR